VKCTEFETSKVWGYLDVAPLAFRAFLKVGQLLGDERVGDTHLLMEARDAYEYNGKGLGLELAGGIFWFV
jgi:hypothetical protein